MKEKIYTGYAVVTEDFSATSFSDYSFETCKRYCRKGYVIIRTYRKKMGYQFRICWYKWYKPFELRSKWGRFNLLWLHVNWDVINHDEWEKEVIWRPDVNSK